MNKLMMPSLLAATVLIAGMFAFMPVQQASTVHTILQDTTTQLIEVTATATATDDEFTITCPTETAACIINDIFIDNGNTGANADVNDVDATIDGATTFTIVKDHNNKNISPNTVAAVSGISNFAMGSGDIVHVNMDGTVDGDDTYTIRVIATVDGNSSITVDRADDGND